MRIRCALGLLLVLIFAACGSKDTPPSHPKAAGPGVAAEAQRDPTAQGRPEAAPTEAAGLVDPTLQRLAALMPERYGYTVVLHPKRLDAAFEALEKAAGDLLPAELRESAPAELFARQIMDLAKTPDPPAGYDPERPVIAGFLRVIGDEDLADIDYGGLPSVFGGVVGLHHRVAVPATDGAALAASLSEYAAKMFGWETIEAPSAAWKLGAGATAFRDRDKLIVLITPHQDSVRVDLVHPGASEAADVAVAAAVGSGARAMTPARHHLLGGHGVGSVHVDVLAAVKAFTAIGLRQTIQAIEGVPPQHRAAAIGSSLGLVMTAPALLGAHDLEVFEGTFSVDVDAAGTIDVRGTTTYTPEFAALRATALRGPGGRTWATAAERPLLSYRDNRSVRIPRPMLAGGGMDALARAFDSLGTQGVLLHRLGNPVQQLQWGLTAASGGKRDQDSAAAAKHVLALLPHALSFHVDRLQFSRDGASVAGAVALDLAAGSDRAMVLVQRIAAELQMALGSTPVVVTEETSGDRQRIWMVVGDAKLVEAPTPSARDTILLKLDAAQAGGVVSMLSPTAAAGLTRVKGIDAVSRTEGLVSGHRLRVALRPEVAAEPLVAVVPLPTWTRPARAASKGLDCLASLPWSFVRLEPWDVSPDQRAAYLAKEMAPVDAAFACGRQDASAAGLAARVEASWKLNRAEMAALGGDDRAAHTIAAALCAEQRSAGACRLAEQTKPVAPPGTLTLPELSWSGLVWRRDSAMVRISSEGLYLQRDRVGGFDQHALAALQAKLLHTHAASRELDRAAWFEIRADKATPLERLAKVAEATRGDRTARIALTVSTPDGLKVYPGMFLPAREGDEGAEGDTKEPAEEEGQFGDPEEEDEEPDAEPDKIDVDQLGLIEIREPEGSGARLFEGEATRPVRWLRILDQTLELISPDLASGVVQVKRGDLVELAKAGEALRAGTGRWGIAVVAKDATWGELAPALAALSGDGERPVRVELHIGEGPGGPGPEPAEVEEEEQEAPDAERPAGKVGIEPGETRGFCKKSDIARVVRRRAGAIRACYERSLAQNSTLRGKLQVRWTITLDGAVSAASATGSMSDTNTRNCVLRLVRRMRFAAPEGGVCIVQWPFVFSPG